MQTHGLRSIPPIACVISALLVARAGAEPESIVIRPSLAYTVQGLSNGVYQNKQPRLYSNGYSGMTSNVASVARMEFEVPPAVLLGLKTAEFRARQYGYLPTDKGYTYLYYYTGHLGETTSKTPYAREGFTAKSVDGGEVFSRNLLEGFSGTASALPKNKFGLMITSWIYEPREVTFEDPQLVITYEPPPEDNADAVNQLLTGAGKPFEGNSDPNVIGFEADPDHDGQPNFLELWRGTAPGQPSTAAAPFFAASADVPYIRIPVDKYVDDRMKVGAQASHDLVDWRDVSATRTTTTTSEGTYAKFTDVIPLAGRKACYFRFVAVPEGKKFE